VALLQAADRSGVDVARLRKAHPIHAERPFDPSVLYSMAARDVDDQSITLEARADGASPSRAAPELHGESVQRVRRFGST
jgi:hypothetical protein